MLIWLKPCIQVNFAENIRQLKILGSCLGHAVTVIYSVTAIYIPVPSYTGLTVEALVKGTVIIVVIKN